MITVFYDGKCGLCSKEIRYYQKIAPQGRFQWLDISTNARALNEFNICDVKALARLHVIDERDILHIGLDGFQIIWSNLKYWKILAAFVSLWPINPVLRILYNKFAAWRFNRLYCKQ